MHLLFVFQTEITNDLIFHSIKIFFDIIGTEKILFHQSKMSYMTYSIIFCDSVTS